LKATDIDIAIGIPNRSNSIC